MAFHRPLGPYNLAGEGWDGQMFHTRGKEFGVRFLSSAKLCEETS